MKMSSAYWFRFIFMQFKLISFDWFRTCTRFETGAQWNSEMAYFFQPRLNIVIFLPGDFRLEIFLWLFLDAYTVKPVSHGPHIK